MKRIFVMILTIVMGCSFWFIFVSCKDKKQTDDDTFYCGPMPVGTIRLELSCKKECDAESIDFNCKYGYQNKDSVKSAPSRKNGYEFEKAVFLYDLLTWDEIREITYNSYFRNKSIGFDPAHSFREYMEREVNGRYNIIKEIPQEDFLTEEYYVMASGFLRETSHKYNHQETVRLTQEQLLPESGFICFGIYLVYYSEEKNDYIVVRSNTSSYFKYTINDGKVRFERITWMFRNNKIIYSDENGNVVWEDTESSFSQEE